MRLVATHLRVDDNIHDVCDMFFWRANIHPSPRCLLLFYDICSQYYRVITGALLHGSLMHIMFNMMSFLAIGSRLVGVSQPQQGMH